MFEDKPPTTELSTPFPEFEEEGGAIWNPADRLY
jgi:hypothetical protein